MAKFTKAQRAEIVRIVTDAIADHELTKAVCRKPGDRVGYAPTSYDWTYSPVNRVQFVNVPPPTETPQEHYGIGKAASYDFAFTTTRKPEYFLVEYIKGYGLRFSDNRMKVLRHFDPAALEPKS